MLTSPHKAEMHGCKARAQAQMRMMQLPTIPLCRLDDANIRTEKAVGMQTMLTYITSWSAKRQI